MSGVTTRDDDLGEPGELEPVTERRGAARLTINKQFDTFDDFVREYVANVSGTGAFVRTDTPLAIGTELPDHQVSGPMPLLIRWPPAHHGFPVKTTSGL